MDFNYTEEQQLLKDSVEKFLAKNYTFEPRREIIEARQGMSPTGLGGLRLDGPAGRADPAGVRRLRRQRGGHHDRDGGVRPALVVEPYLSTVVLGASAIVLGGTEAAAQDTAADDRQRLDQARVRARRAGIALFAQPRGDHRAPGGRHRG